VSAFFAHSGDRADYADWQLLRLHLENVGGLARRFAAEACPGDNSLAGAALAAGLLHDLGKYRPEFQQMIRGVPGVPREKTYHKQAGAAKSERCLPVAFAISGHHGGIPDLAEAKEQINGPAGKTVATAVWNVAQEDCPSLSSLDFPTANISSRLHGELFTRLIFSCLVDADWADTGEHERVRKNWPEDPRPARFDAGRWLERVLAYVAERARQCRDERIKQIRAEVLEASLAAGALPPGLFSLSVPTGGGKTLSGLAFALQHAAAHGKRRIIYVAPYLSIIDQNARVIREALNFSKDSPEVLEHHSLSEPPSDEEYDTPWRQAAARRAENWDAPLIITTSVQFYESLFSNQPGRCRKLHNVAGSVIILDECQTLPPDLVRATCGMLNQLTVLGCSILLCTATQPAFDHDELKEDERLRAREIVPPRLNLFTRLKRVQLTWPKDQETMTWVEVAATMQQGLSALCIVNSKRAARELFAELKKTAGPVFHLSTSMCPAHRLEVLDEVKRRLGETKPVYLVSTQLIEAGVDIDFPLVLREIGPLEAVIQAAGRCNREGLMRGPGGRVVIFRSAAALAQPTKYYPSDRWYRAGRDKVENDFLRDGREPRIDSPDDIREYFNRLYYSGDLDKKRIRILRENLQFQTVAAEYVLIEADGVPVVVTMWEGHQAAIEMLLQEVREKPNRAKYRRLARYQVNVRRNQLHTVGALVSEEVPAVQVYRGVYNSDLGLTGESADMLLLV
jgi:CRISPR-associated endonuclease/helicase Cas3